MDPNQYKVFLVVVVLILFALAIYAFARKYEDDEKKEDKKTYKSPTRTKADIKGNQEEKKDANLNDILDQQKRIATNTKYIFNLLFILFLLSIIASFFNFLIK